MFWSHYQEFKHGFESAWSKIGKDLLSKSLAKNLFKPILNLASEGKRLRPYLIYLGAEISGYKKRQSIQDLGLVVEMIHTFALVHDDIIDNSDTRRHRDTVHIWFKKTFKQRHHFGISAAILSGDALLSAAFNFFYLKQKQHQWPEAVEKVFHLLIQEVIAGEYLEHELTAGSKNLSPKILKQIASLKSGRYSIQRPLELGLALGGTVNTDLSHLAEDLGVAFQVQDDLLGVIGDSKLTGKPTMSDILERKRTFILLYAWQASAKNPQARKMLQKYLYATDQEAGISKIMAKKIFTWFDSSGAILKTQKFVTKEFGRLEQKALKLKLSSQHQDLLISFIQYLAKRNT